MLGIHLEKEERFFPMAEVGNLQFLLLTKNSYIELYQTLGQWISENETLSEEKYEDEVEKLLKNRLFEFDALTKIGKWSDKDTEEPKKPSDGELGQMTPGHPKNFSNTSRLSVLSDIRKN